MKKIQYFSKLNQAILILSLVLVSSASLFAQSKEESQKKAKEIIEKYIEAIGGKENLAKVKSWDIKGRLHPSKAKASARFVVKGNKNRYTLKVFGQAIIEAYNGKTFWTLNPFKENKPIIQNKKPKSSNFVNMLYPMYLMGQDMDKALYDGTSMLNGKKTHLIHCFSGIDRRDYYFDQQTFLLLKRKTHQVTAEFNGYRKDKKLNLVIPGLVKITSDTPMILDDIKGGIEISDQLFEMPKDNKAAKGKFEKLRKKGKTLASDKNLSAKKIVKGYIKKYRKVTSVKSLVVKAYLHLGQAKFPLVMYVSKDKYRMEATMMQQKIIKAFNSKITWETNISKSKKPVIIENDSSKNEVTELMDETLFFYKKEGSTIEYTAREYVGENLCHKIKLTKKDKEVFFYYLGTKDGLLYKTQNEQKNSISYFSDFKKTKYGYHPYTIDTIESNGQHMVFKVKSYTFDQPINDKIFEFPGKDKKK